MMEYFGEMFLKSSEFRSIRLKLFLREKKTVCMKGNQEKMRRDKLEIETDKQ